jgi:hypothetical protein
MNELATLLEWLGTGLAGLLILVVVLMFAAIINAGRKDRDWD